MVEKRVVSMAVFKPNLYSSL